MTEQGKMSCFCLKYVLLLFLLFLNVVYADSMGTKYIKYLLEREEICHPLGNNPLSNRLGTLDVLRKYTDSAILVRPAYLFNSWHVRSDMICKFRIKAPKGYGLFGVIQSMLLRVNQTECIDYIRFYSEDGGYSPKFCGKLYFDDHRKRHDQMLRFEGGIQNQIDSSDENESEYRFLPDQFETASKQGKLTTEIFISKQPLAPGEKLDLLIVYTPYKPDCNFSTDNVQPGTNSFNSNKCINSKFICDEYLNCASYKCMDEANCTEIYNKIYDDISGNKLPLAAMSTIFLCFIIFMLSLWICKKHEVLCWSSDCAGPSSESQVNRSSSGPMDFSQQGTQNTPYVASAPMLEVTEPLTLHNKDLPPSYDSLFPSESNATS